MDIKSQENIEVVVGEMHDSEFGENDFSFIPQKKTFYLKTFSAGGLREVFYLEFYNVKKYKPINLDKIKKGKATGGVFNDIKVKDNGLRLILISQDLKILLELTKLEGKFEKVEE